MTIFKIYQAIWLGIGIFTLFFGGFNLFRKETPDNNDYILLIIAVISFSMFFFKRRNKKYYEKVFDKNK